MKLSKILKPLLFLFSALLFFIRCSNDTPVSSRFDLIGANEVGEILQVNLQPPLVDSTAGRIVNNGSSPLLYLGTYNNIKTRLLIQFSSLPVGAVVRSAELVLPTYRALGSGASFEATAHRVTSEWDEALVKDDNFNNAFDAGIAGTQMVVVADSDSVFIVLDRALVSGWIDSSIVNYGVLLQAPAATFAKQFHSRNSILGKPLLRLSYTKNNADSTEDIKATKDAFLFEVVQPPVVGPLYVSHGTDYHSLVKFDLSSLPQGATINRAQLIFTIDRAHSRLTTDGMALRLERVGKNSSDPISAAEGSTVQLDQVKVVTDSSEVFFFEIRATVQNWTRLVGDLNRIDNFGVVLLAQSPDIDLQQLAIHSKESNPALAPTLKIDYTLPPRIQ